MEKNLKNVEEKAPKKKRSENWTTEEKEVLRNLIMEAKDILEDKSNKTSMTLLKNAEWKKITIKFNEIMGRSRKGEEIRDAWKRMKLVAKTNVAAYRRESRKTGGGAKPPSPTQEDLEIMDIAPHDFLIESNNFDSDAMSPLAAEAQVHEIEDISDPEEPYITVPKRSKINMPDPDSKINITEKDKMKIRNISDPEEPYITVPKRSKINMPDPDSKINITEKDKMKIRNISDPEEPYITVPKRSKINMPDPDSKINITEKDKMKIRMINTKTKEQDKSKKINKTEDIRLSILANNAQITKRKLEILEEEHRLTKKIKLLKIKKLELEISILENDCMLE